MQPGAQYTAAETRYDSMVYNRCGKSGLKLPAISLGLWHNFAQLTPMETQRAMCRTAFDLGITHFDIANNYGPPAGEAEINLGQILERDFRPYRDELIIATKAGYTMWPGPYGDWGSKKSLVSSLDQSLRRMKLDYVDIFYHHRPDPNTPLEETIGALDLLVRQGKALYVGISNYDATQTKAAIAMFKELRTPFVIHQARYNMFDRKAETGGLLDELDNGGAGCIVFSPLAQGLLTGKYVDGIPADSRIGRDPRFLRAEQVTPEVVAKVQALHKLAEQRGQSLTQLALAWVLRRDTVTSALIGASRPAQLAENVATLQNLTFTPDELAEIDKILL